MLPPKLAALFREMEAVRGKAGGRDRRDPMAGPGTDPLPDERLVAAVLDGDVGAFAVLAGRNKRQVLRIATRFDRIVEERHRRGRRWRGGVRDAGP